MVLSGMQREMGGFLGKMKGVAGAVWSSDPSSQDRCHGWHHQGLTGSLQADVLTEATVVQGQALSISLLPSPLMVQDQRQWSFSHRWLYWLNLLYSHYLQFWWCFRFNFRHVDFLWATSDYSCIDFHIFMNFPIFSCCWFLILLLCCWRINFMWSVEMFSDLTQGLSIWRRLLCNSE